MGQDVKLPGWGHLDFSFEWSLRKIIGLGIIWLVLLVYAAYKLVTYVILCKWVRDLWRWLTRSNTRPTGPFDR